MLHEPFSTIEDLNVTDFHGKPHVELSKLDKADCESRERIGPVQHRLILSFFSARRHFIGF